MKKLSLKKILRPTNISFFACCFRFLTKTFSFSAIFEYFFSFTKKEMILVRNDDF